MRYIVSVACWLLFATSRARARPPAMFASQDYAVDISAERRASGVCNQHALAGVWLRL